MYVDHQSYPPKFHRFSLHLYIIVRLLNENLRGLLQKKGTLTQYWCVRTKGGRWSCSNPHAKPGRNDLTRTIHATRTRGVARTIPAQLTVTRLTALGSYRAPFLPERSHDHSLGNFLRCHPRNIILALCIFLLSPVSAHKSAKPLGAASIAPAHPPSHVSTGR